MAVEKMRPADRKLWLLVGMLLTCTSNYCGTAYGNFSFTSFGVNGSGGTLNGQTLSFGTAGRVFQLESFFNIDADDLNGGDSGTSANLASDALPPELEVSFQSQLTTDKTDLLLTYRIVNSGSLIPNASFFSFVDAEIAGNINSVNEYASTSGSIGAGPADIFPDSWEIDEPGFEFGDIYANVLAGALDKTNAIPQSSPEDVAMALGFRLAAIGPRDVIEVKVLLSDDGTTLGDFSLRHQDVTVSDSLHMSGEARIIRHISGDYDGDGTVASGDYSFWKTSLGGITAAFAGADGNGDGFVDAADYTVWRDNFQASMSAAAVPEPSTALLIVFAACSAAIFMHRK